MKSFFALLFGILFLIHLHTFGQGEVTSTGSTGELSKGISTASMMNSSGWGIAIKASTFGPGLEVIKAFNIPVNLRLGGTWLRYSADISSYISNANDTKVVNNIQFGTVSLFADWQFVNFMHLTVGALYNFSEETIDVYLQNLIYVGDVEVTPETMGYTSAKIYTSKINPYLGIGFGRSISKYKLVGFGVDLGVAYIGSPKVDLMANGMLQPTAETITTADGATLNKEIIENNVSSYKFYPILNFQLSFRLSGRE